MVNTFPDENIFSALRRKLNWTSIKIVMYIDDQLKRNFYIEKNLQNSDGDNIWIIKFTI
ncbi:MAG: hypothetical protein FWC47_03855 [Oscillospiraceae bacterium]|nr:hypothetical protein [Oscillospiraceae bacterium]